METNLNIPKGWRKLRRNEHIADGDRILRSITEQGYSDTVIRRLKARKNAPGAGRPPKPLAARRKSRTLSLAPETLRAILRAAEAQGKPPGAIVDWCVGETLPYAEP